MRSPSLARRSASAAGLGSSNWSIWGSRSRVRHRRMMRDGSRAWTNNEGNIVGLELLLGLVLGVQERASVLLELALDEEAAVGELAPVDRAADESTVGREARLISSAWPIRRAVLAEWTYLLSDLSDGSTRDCGRHECWLMVDGFLPSSRALSLDLFWASARARLTFNHVGPNCLQLPAQATSRSPEAQTTRQEM